MKKYTASYTVEMALIFPFILFVLFAVLYLGMSVHDSVKLKIYMENTARLLQTAALHPLDLDNGSLAYQKIGGLRAEKDIDAEVRNKFLDLCNSKLWITEVKEVRVHTGIMKIQIETRQSLKISELKVLPFFRDGMRMLKSSILKYQPENTVRVKPEHSREMEKRKEQRPSSCGEEHLSESGV